MDTIVVPPNTTCSGLDIIKGTVPTTPSSLTAHTFDTVHGEPPFYIDDRIINGSKFYVALGCVAHTTFETTHRTGFCYLLEWTPAENRRVFSACARRFDVD
jgi:hypothetical protein